jgi:hypothetical protein
LYAAIRQGKAKASMAEVLAHYQGGGDPDHQRCSGIPSLLRDLCSRPHGDGNQHLQRLRECRGVQQTRTRMDRAEPGAPALRTSHSRSRAGDRAHVGLASRERAGDGASRERMAAWVSPTARLIAHAYFHWSLRSRFRLNSYSRGTALAPAFASAHHRARNTGVQVFVKGLRRR